MVCEGNLSADISRSRILLLRDTDCQPSTSLSSFFKVVFGEGFSSVLILPPKFAPTISILVNHKICLEDILGKRWQVTLSNHNGNLAFQEGWHEFFLDHGLEFGYFLVFHYLEESHFVVQIYNRSGCEYLNFPWKNTKGSKRKFTTNDSNVTCDPRVDNNCSNHKQSPVSSVFRSNEGTKQTHFDVIDAEEIPAFKRKMPNQQNNEVKPQPIPFNGGFSDEISCIVDRTLENKGVCRNSLFDLSSFEMFTTEAGGLVKDGKHQAGVCNILPLEVSNMKVMKETRGSKVRNEMIGKKKVICSGKNTENLSVGRSSNDQTTIHDATKKNQTNEISCNENKTFSSQKQSNLRSESIKWKFDKQLTTAKQKHDSNAPKIENSHCGKGTDSSPEKRSGVLTLPVKNEDNKVQQILKIEPDQFSPPSSSSISCLVNTDDRSFLELPECLPRPAGKCRLKLNRCLVMLRDAKGREYGVMYHQTPSATILGSGWEAFCKMNDIGCNHSLTFQLLPNTEAHEPAYAVAVDVPSHS